MAKQLKKVQSFTNYHCTSIKKSNLKRKINNKNDAIILI